MKRSHFAIALPIVTSLLLLVHPTVRSAVDHTYEEMKMLVEVMNLIRDNYVQEVENKKLVYGAASGMVRALDPFSQF